MMFLTIVSLGVIAAVVLASPTDQPSDAQATIDTFDAQPTTTTITATWTLSPLPTPDLISVQVGADSSIGYRSFRVINTEYCQASEGHPEVAKGKVIFGGNAFTVYYGENTAGSVNLGYPGVNLIFGPYSYWSRRIKQFNYGTCKWGETGYKECGYCWEDKPWTPEGNINCAAGNQEPRVHILECMVAVEWY